MPNGIPRRESIKLSTVNVIEVVGSPIGMHSFTDNPTGNKRAERIFKRCIIENCGSSIPTKDELATFIEDGTFEMNGYHVYLTHST